MNRISPVVSALLNTGQYRLSLCAYMKSYEANHGAFWNIRVTFIHSMITILAALFEGRAVTKLCTVSTMSLLLRILGQTVVC